MTTNKQKKNKGNKKKKNASVKQTPAQRSTKQYTQARAPAPMKRSPPAVAKTLHSKVCSITDPFCPHAKGAFYPDGQNSGAIPFQSRKLVTYGANSGAANVHKDKFVVYIGGSVNYPVLRNVGIDSGTAYKMATAFSADPIDTTITGYANRYRIVSWGFIIRATKKASDVQGIMTISRQSEFPALNSQTVEPGLFQGSDVQSIPLYPGMEVSVVPRRLGSNSTFFQPVSVSDTTVNTGWEVIKLEVSGIPNGDSPISIEFYYNLELQLKSENAIIQQSMRMPPPAANAVISASTSALANVAVAVEGGVEKVGNHILDKVESAVGSLLSDFIGFF